MQERIKGVRGTLTVGNAAVGSGVLVCTRLPIRPPTEHSPIESARGATLQSVVLQ
jgi:hypothetical protein